MSDTKTDAEENQVGAPLKKSNVLFATVKECAFGAIVGAAMGTGADFLLPKFPANNREMRVVPFTSAFGATYGALKGYRDAVKHNREIDANATRDR